MVETTRKIFDHLKNGMLNNNDSIPDGLSYMVVELCRCTSKTEGKQDNQIFLHNYCSP